MQKAGSSRQVVYICMRQLIQQDLRQDLKISYHEPMQ